MPEKKFTHSDAWIYLCIPLNKPGIDRPSILAQADHINQAVPTAEELEGALQRGTAAGLIEHQDGKYFFGNRYRSPLKKIFSSNSNPLQTWDTLEEFLHTL